MKRLAAVLFDGLALVCGVLSVVLVAVTVRSLFAQDEYRLKQKEPYSGIFVEDDLYSRDTFWFATTGKAGLAVGRSVLWREVENRKSKRFGYDFGYDTYPNAYPIQPTDEPLDKDETRHTLGPFQYAHTSGVSVRLPNIHPIQPLKREGKFLQDADGFAIYPQPRVPQEWSDCHVTLPLPLLLVLTAAPPLWWGRRTVRRRRLARRRAAGDCLGCGYPLRQTPHAPHCPECGLAAVGAPS